MFRKALDLLCKLLGASRGTDHNSAAQVVLSCDASTLHAKTPDALKLPRFSSATGDLPVAKIELRVGDALWSQVSTFDGAGPDHRAYVLDLDAEKKLKIKFGDGITGARPCDSEQPGNS